MFAVITMIAHFLAPLISLLKLAPQAVKTFKNRKDTKALQGVSVLTQWMVVLSGVLWILLGVGLNSFTVYFPTIFQLSFALFIVWLIGKGTTKKVFMLPISILMSLPIIYSLIFGLEDWHMLLINIVAPILSFAMFIPQAVLAWKYRADKEYIKGISAGGQWLLILNAISWGIVAYDLQSFAVGAPGLVNLPLAVFTLIIIYRTHLTDTSTTKINSEILEPEKLMNVKNSLSQLSL